MNRVIKLKQENGDEVELTGKPAKFGVEVLEHGPTQVAVEYAVVDEGEGKKSRKAKKDEGGQGGDAEALGMVWPGKTRLMVVEDGEGGETPTPEPTPEPTPTPTPEPGDPGEGDDQGGCDQDDDSDGGDQGQEPGDDSDGGGDADEEPVPSEPAPGGEGDQGGEEKPGQAA